MSNNHEHEHHDGCCSHQHQDFLKAELAKQIEEILKKREKAVLHTHSENCRHCSEDDAE